MATNNPKVSAYIPQHIFNRFQSFCQEKGMSMSQATAVVFAGYFEIEPEVNHSSGLLADRVRELELKLSEVSSPNSSSIDPSKEIFSELKSELLDILLEKVKSNIDEVQKSLFSRLESELKDSSLKALERGSVSSSLDELLTEPFDDKGNKQLGLSVGEKSLDEPIAKKPLKSVTEKINISKKTNSLDFSNGVDILSPAELIERFQCAASLPSKQKGRYKNEPEKFINWAKKKDPDGYGWEFREGSNLFYRVEPLA